MVEESTYGQQIHGPKFHVQNLGAEWDWIWLSFHLKVEIFQPDQMAKYFFQSLDICRNEKFANSIKDMPKWGQKTLKTVKGL